LIEKRILKVIFRVFTVIIILVIVFCPFLLIIDFQRYTPVVLLVWVLSIAYYIFSRRTKPPRQEKNLSPDEQEKPQKEEDVV